MTIPELTLRELNKRLAGAVRHREDYPCLRGFAEIMSINSCTCCCLRADSFHTRRSNCSYAGSSGRVLRLRSALGDYHQIVMRKFYTQNQMKTLHSVCIIGVKSLF